MPCEVILPRVDMDMATGKISRWLVDDGAPVRKGQPLFEIETDKAAMEIEAEASGTIRTLTRAGADDVAVGSTVAWIYRDGESETAATLRAEASPRRDPAAEPPPPISDDTRRTFVTAAPAAEAGSDRRRATPLARRLARERGHDLVLLTGTGPRGRVQASDIPPAAATPAGSRPSAGGLVTLRDGAGVPLVLVHGFGADRDGWRPFLQGYDRGRPVLALDLPGHGTAKLDGAAGFDALVDGVETALVEARLGAFTLVGHSLGGAVAAAVAARGAVDLDALVLIAPVGLGPEINRGFVAGFLGASSEASLAPWLRELVADPSLVTPAFVRLSLRTREPALDEQRRVAAAVFPDGTQAFSIRADLARIACPVRVIVGTADRIVPARHADTLPGLVALHRLPGIGHMPHIEAREVVQAIIAQASRG